MGYTDIYTSSLRKHRLTPQFPLILTCEATAALCKGAVYGQSTRTNSSTESTKTQLRFHTLEKERVPIREFLGAYPMKRAHIYLFFGRVEEWSIINDIFVPRNNYHGTLPPTWLFSDHGNNSRHQYHHHYYSQTCSRHLQWVVR